MAILINSNLLNQDEQALLMGYAHGQSAERIASNIDCSRADLRTIELNARAKLGAKNSGHLMSRAWELGIFKNTLCLLLAVLAINPSDSAIRINRTRSNRTPNTITRLATGQAGRNLKA